MRKPCLKAFMIMVTLFLSSSALAGISIAGDGGHGVFCRSALASPSRKNGTVRFLDTKEAEDRLGFSEEFGSGTVHDRIETAGERLMNAGIDASIAQSIVEHARHIHSYKIIKKIGKTGDYGPLYARSRNLVCYLVQIALRSRDTVSVNSQYYDRLSSNDRAALALHEALHLWIPDKKDTLVIRQILWFLSAPADFRERRKDLLQYLIIKKKPLALARFYVDLPR